LPVHRLVDSHLHLWAKTRDSHAWIQPGTQLDRAFTARDAELQLREAAVDQVILVQADQTPEDTDFLLDMARENSWVLGVVGWGPIFAPTELAHELERWRDQPLLRGLRLRCDRAESEKYGEPPQRSLQLLAEHGLTIDVLSRGSAGLVSACSFAARLPSQPVVLNHLGRPPFGAADFVEWRAAIAQFALFDNTYAKISGLAGCLAPDQEFRADNLRPAWEAALESFGPQRIMFGGDWPVSTRFASYQSTIDVLGALIDELTEDERALIWGETARRAYRVTRVRA
jgi:L-fuconolactonase